MSMWDVAARAAMDEIWESASAVVDCEAGEAVPRRMVPVMLLLLWLICKITGRKSKEGKLRDNGELMMEYVS
jgi:hypothetical protein